VGAAGLFYIELSEYVVWSENPGFLVVGRLLLCVISSFVVSIMEGSFCGCRGRG